MTFHVSGSYVTFLYKFCSLETFLCEALAKKKFMQTRAELNEFLKSSWLIKVISLIWNNIFINELK